MNIPCPSCDQRLEIPQELAGQTIECPACNTSLTTPALAAPPPPLPTPPPPIAPTQNKRKAPQATTGRKTKSPFPKWAIAVFVGVALIAVAAILFIPSDQNGSSITQQESTTKAPDISIHDAAKDGNIEAVTQHIDAGTDVDTKNSLEDTPLYFAVAWERWEIAKLLIAKGADVNAKSSDYDKTPLHLAMIEDNMEIVELLIAKGADVNAKTTSDLTPLHIAAYKNHKEIAEKLIAKGAVVNMKDVEGMTPLDMVNATEIEDLLRKHGGKNGTIHGAARIDDSDAVNEFLANGTDVNAKNGNEVTPLHLAAHHGYKKTVELLIAKGANMNAKDNDGETPLDRAIKQKHAETADLLRKHGGKTGEELKAAGK